MGKKKNKKFKKVSAQTSINSPIQGINRMLGPDKSDQTIDIVESAGSQGTSKNLAVEEAVDPRYLIVRHDVKKVLITLGSLMILLFLAYFINDRTGVLNRFGDWIYQVANIKML